MVKEAAVIGQSLPEKAECRQHACPQLTGRKIPAFICDAQRSQTETSRGNTGHCSLVVSVHSEAVPDQPGFGVSLLPEEEEIGVLDLFQKLLVFIGKRRGYF